MPRIAKLPAVAVACLSSLSTAGHASVDVVDTITDLVAHPCNACSEVQIVDKARSLGRGYHYVYDVVGNSVHRIDVECEPSPQGGTYCTGGEASVPSEVSATFNAIEAAYVANGHSLTFVPTVEISIASPNSMNPDGTRHDDGYINAYDTVTMSAADFLVTKCLSDFACSYSFVSGSPALQASLIQMIQYFKNSVINFADIVISFNVVLHDGSQATYRYDPDAKTWNRVPGTARDAHHNLIDPIPKAPHQFIVQGGNNYDGGNVARLVETIIVGGPHCVALDWDGERLTCLLAP